jgi:excisionase family DNA binding protein
MMTYQELADWWNVPIGTIYSWVARGCIPHVRLADRSVRFERAALEAWIDERRSMPGAVHACDPIEEVSAG